MVSASSTKPCIHGAQRNKSDGRRRGQVGNHEDPRYRQVVAVLYSTAPARATPRSPGRPASRPGARPSPANPGNRVFRPTRSGSIPLVRRPHVLSRPRSTPRSSAMWFRRLPVEVLSRSGRAGTGRATSGWPPRLRSRVSALAISGKPRRRLRNRALSVSKRMK